MSEPSVPPLTGHAVFAALLALLLAACSVKLPGEGPPPRLFTLNPGARFDPNLPAARWRLVVETPSAPAGLDTVRIAVRRGAFELDYYANAAWIDRVPSMVQTLLIESLENSGKIAAVGRDADGLRTDYLLKTDIRHFEVDEGPEGPSAHVQLFAKLIKMPEREIVADRACDEHAGAAAGTLERVVEGYNDALEHCVRQFVEWTLVTGTRRIPAGSPVSLEGIMPAPERIWREARKAVKHAAKPSCEAADGARPTPSCREASPIFATLVDLEPGLDLVIRVAQVQPRN